MEKNNNNQKPNQSKTGVIDKKIIIYVAIFLVFVSLVKYSESVELPSDKVKNIQKRELPMKQAAKLLKPDRYYTDEEVKELFCRRICSAGSSGEWNK